MRKITSLMFALIFGLSFLANAQDVQKDQPKGYQFTDIKRLPATSVRIKLVQVPAGHGPESRSSNQK